ncbi:MAG: YgfZ/GcvT domain-containing protein [Dehalococcoidia bacterium]
MSEKPVFVDLADYFSRIDLYGEDSLDLLDRLSTNKLENLIEPYTGMGSVLTTNKGRIIDLLGVNRLPDKVLVTTAKNSKEKVIEWIEFYTIMEDVSIKDISAETCHFRLIGEGWNELFPRISELSVRDSMCCDIESESVIVIKEEMSGVLCIDVIGPSTARSKLGDFFSKRFNQVDLKEFNRFRLKLGIPVFGFELTEDFNPLEAGLMSHISFNKGCYIGQEVVARLNTYDKVQRKLVKFAWQGNLEQNEITCDGKPIGVITSAESGIGLGFVRNTYAELEKELDCGERKIVVTEILAE